MSVRKLAFFFDAQEGVCCLRSSYGCRAADGLMNAQQVPLTNPRRASWDHIKPRSKGGRTVGNVLLACAECNHSRGSKPAPEGLAERAADLYAQWSIIRDANGKPNSRKKARKAKKVDATFAATMALEDGMARREMAPRGSAARHLGRPWSLADERALRERISKEQEARAERNWASYESALRHIAANKQRLGRK